MQNITFSAMKPLASLNEIESTKNIKTENNLFKDIFNNVVENVKATNDELAKQQYLLAIGEIEDPHTVTIAATKAQISVDLMVQLRNRAMESYNELMRINL